jgi:hypothetical protein
MGRDADLLDANLGPGWWSCTLARRHLQSDTTDRRTESAFAWAAADPRSTQNNAIAGLELAPIAGSDMYI